MNTYLAYYKNRKVEVREESPYLAQRQAALHFKARRPWEVAVVLVAVGDRPVHLDPASI